MEYNFSHWGIWIWRKAELETLNFLFKITSLYLFSVPIKYYGSILVGTQSLASLKIVAVKLLN